MTPKRHVNIMPDNDNATFMLLATLQHGKLKEEALAIELRKLEKLYKVKVLLYKLMEGGHHLILVVHKMKNKMTPEEARKRNEAYDAMLCVGLPATSDLPAVPPQKVYHPHHYPAEKMCDIPSFMHDFMRASCERSGRLQRPAEDPTQPTTEYRPYVFKRYQSIRLQLDCLPRIFSSDDVKKIRQKLQGLGYQGVVRRASEDEEMYVSRRAVGCKAFVQNQIAYDDSLGERFCYKDEKRMKCVREPSIDDLRRIVVYSEQYYQELLKFNLDDSLALEAAKSIIEANYWQPALPMLLMAAPFLGALMIYDGMNRWLTLSRMRRDGTLSRLRFEAVRRARNLVMPS